MARRSSNHPAIKSVTFTPTGDTAKALGEICAKKDIFAHMRGATEAEALTLLSKEKAQHAKDVGQNVLKVFLDIDRSFYTKGTVKVRAALSEFL